MKLSDMPLDELKKTPWFHTVDPVRLASFEDLAAWLESILHNPCEVWEEYGEMVLIETRQLVDRVGGLKIEIYPGEHPPPHFHVRTPRLNTSFDIETCELIAGEIDRRDKKKIELWHREATPLLVETWNAMRPTDCTVGPYSGT